MSTVVESITIGGLCMESYPCQHNCTITYKDGTTKRVTMDASTIVEFWDLLTEPEKRHFQYAKDNDYFRV